MRLIRVAGMVGAILAVAAAAHAQEVGQTQVTPASFVQASEAKAVTVPAQETRRIQGFSVVLLLGEAQGSATPDGLSAPARKALADLKDFLPYKGYRVLDTQWIAGTERGSMLVRLRGPDNQDYVFGTGGLQPIDTGSAISGSVELSTPSVSEATRAQAMARIAQLDDVVRSGGRNVADAQRELAQLKQVVAGGQQLIRTTLRISPGETVVVGTSRVQGDKALIVLLTAVPR